MPENESLPYGVPAAPEAPEDAPAGLASRWTPDTAADAGVPRGWVGQGPPTTSQGFALLPRGVGEVVDTGIAVYRQHWRLLFGTAACVMVPIQFLNAFLNGGVVPQLQNLFTGLLSGRLVQTSSSGVGLLGIPVVLIATALVNAALAFAAASVYLGRSTTVGQVWRTTIRRFWAIIGLGIMRSMLVVFGFFFLVVPGIFLNVRLQPSTEALVVENVGPVGALERAWRLTGGNWWRIAGVVVLRFVIYLFVLSVLESVSFALAAASRSTGWLVLGVAASLSSVALVPFGIVVTVVLYFDLRIRKEAFDLAVVAQQAMPAPQAA